MIIKIGGDIQKEWHVEEAGNEKEFIHMAASRTQITASNPLVSLSHTWTHLDLCSTLRGSTERSGHVGTPANSGCGGGGGNAVHLNL